MNAQVINHSVHSACMCHRVDDRVPLGRAANVAAYSNYSILNIDVQAAHIDVLTERKRGVDAGIDLRASQYALRMLSQALGVARQVLCVFRVAAQK